MIYNIIMYIIVLSYGLKKLMLQKEIVDFAKKKGSLKDNDMYVQILFFTIVHVQVYSILTSYSEEK